MEREREREDSVLEDCKVQREEGGGGERKRTFNKLRGCGGWGEEKG